MRRLGRMAAAAVSAALMLTTAACDDSGTQPSELSDSTSTSTSAPTSESTASSPSTDPEEQAVITAYKGWFETINGMGLATDEQVVAALSPYATEPLVQNAVTLFANKRAEGLIPGGTVNFAALDVTLQANDAVVLECRDTSSETSVEIATGKVVASGAPATRIEASLVRDGEGVWKIADYSAQEGQC